MKRCVVADFCHDMMVPLVEAPVHHQENEEYDKNLKKTRSMSSMKRELITALL